MADKPRIAIVGGGLAGLATAKALDTFGFEAEIFERASSLSEIGAGINTSPQAVKALRAIGLGDRIAAVANVAVGVFTRDMYTGEKLEYRDVRDAVARHGAPHYTFHRADLMAALASGVDPARIRLDHRLTEIEERADGVRLAFANGATRDADIVIGADGIHSVVRRALYGDDNPAYTGQMVWRALLKGSIVPPELLEPTGHVQWIGAGRHFFAYYLRGRDVLNIVTQEDTDKWVEEGWSTPGDPDEMRASFPNAEPRLAAVLALVTECSKWGLFTRPLTDKWGRGRIQLDRRRGARHAAQRRPGGVPGVRGRLHPGPLARCRARRSRRGARELPPRPHPARARRAEALGAQRQGQAHARPGRAAQGDRQGVRRGGPGVDLGLRSRRRLEPATCGPRSRIGRGGRAGNRTQDLLIQSPF